jgi:hypothetical protein
MNKPELQQWLPVQNQQWEALRDQIGEARMDEGGVAGHDGVAVPLAEPFQTEFLTS